MEAPREQEDFMNIRLAGRFAAIALVLAVLPLLAADPTATGTVVSVGPTSLVILTDSGQQTFLVNTATLKPVDLAKDHKVIVTYRLDGPDMIATNVALGPATMASGESVLANDRDDQVIGDGEDDNVTGYDRDAARDDAVAARDETAGALPQTASRTPLVALLGALALVGALALRFTR
jgi:hypothetical protein